MPEVQRERKYFTLRKGLNTVSNEISFPDEFTSDELNYTIESDGSRRRRKGLAEESGGSTKTVVSIASGQYNQSYKWKNVGGNPAENLVVHQIGYTLYFTDDAETMSTTYLTETVDLSLDARKVATATTAATIGGEPCSFAVHRGFLVVTHKYLKPFVVTWDSTTLTVSEIDLLVRDFEGIDDGVSMTSRPVAATVDPDHLYNLINRGWNESDINTYKGAATVSNENPAKTMIPYLGYIRTYGTNINQADGTRSFSTAKMEAEFFGKSSAPQGSLFLDPLDTTVAVGVSEGQLETALSFASGDFDTSPTSASKVTVTATAHGISAGGDDFTVSGHLWTYDPTGGDGEEEWTALNRVWTPTATAGTAPTAWGEAQISDVNTIVFYVPAISDWQSWISTAYDGQVDGGTVISNSDGKALTVGPSVCETFAGRIWYAGIDDAEWADTVFFSQVSLKTNTFGKCHQEADPTDEFNNQLRPGDGGTIVIPNMGVVNQLKATRNAVLVFATNGVWEITGGRGGFAATSFSVRQITDAGCTSPLSLTQFENSVVYTGPKGVMALSPNQYTGQLEDQNLTSQILEPTWNAITSANQARIQTAYDDAKKRLYVMYRENATLSHTYDRALVFDLKNEGWYRLGFNYGAAAGIISMVSISDADSSETNQKMKFQCQLTATTVDTCDMNQSAYLDFDGSESPTPYLVTGWDSSAGFQRRKQAPVIHVFNKRTGTGWTDAGGGDWSEDNEGSTLMTPFWDWTEATQWDVPSAPTAQEPWDASANNYGLSGKIGKQVETYRHVRAFTPLATSDVDGYPVLATRNKVRGRGRVLSMRFDGAATKDSHLLGFTMNYKITRSK